MCKEVLFPLAAGLPSVSEGFDSFLQLFGLFPLTVGQAIKASGQLLTTTVDMTGVYRYPVVLCFLTVYGS